MSFFWLVYSLFFIFTSSVFAQGTLKQDVLTPSALIQTSIDQIKSWPKPLNPDQVSSFLFKLYPRLNKEFSFQMSFQERLDILNEIFQFFFKDQFCPTNLIGLLPEKKVNYLLIDSLHSDHFLKKFSLDPIHPKFEISDQGNSYFQIKPLNFNHTLNAFEQPKIATHHEKLFVQQWLTWTQCSITEKDCLHPPEEMTFQNGEGLFFLGSLNQENKELFYLHVFPLPKSKPLHPTGCISCLLQVPFSEMKAPLAHAYGLKSLSMIAHWLESKGYKSDSSFFNTQKKEAILFHWITNILRI